MKEFILLAGLGAALLQNGPEARPAFDVASVRPSTAPFSTGLKTGPERLAIAGASLSDLIRQAYGVSDQQISGIPEAFGRFDVEGKAEGSHPPSELLQMLQALLADRFKLTLHRETKELPAAVLVAAKGPLKVQPAANDGDPRISFGAGKSPDSVAVRGQNVTMNLVANYLSNRLRRVVVDRTGLAGNFDFNVEFAMDRTELLDRTVPVRDAVAHLFTDFVDRLGLKLESRRVPVELLVIDHLETPAANE
jgi:uncharacterized protein (TIGR03435 family)